MFATGDVGSKSFGVWYATDEASRPDWGCRLRSDKNRKGELGKKEGKEEARHNSSAKEDRGTYCASCDDGDEEVEGRKEEGEG